MSSFLFPSPSPQPFSSEDLGAARQALGWACGRGWLQHRGRAGGWAVPPPPSRPGHGERGPGPWEWGSACLAWRALGCLGQQGQEEHPRIWMAGCGQIILMGQIFKNTSSLHFSSAPVNSACAVTGPPKAPQVTRPEGSGIGRERGRTEPPVPHSSTLSIHQSVPWCVAEPVEKERSPLWHIGHCQIAMPCPMGWPDPDLSLQSLSPAAWFWAAVVCVTPLQRVGG